VVEVGQQIDTGELAVGDECPNLADRVEDVALGAPQRFDRQRDLMLCRQRPDPAEEFGELYLLKDAD